MVVQLVQYTGNYGHMVGITRLYFYSDGFLAGVNEVSSSNKAMYYVK